ncbi:uncharacterized protein PRCAT00000067001 [Priceomyces carsonii]|uniref:uncharacterized protein n=1 Tax=Priceomyces carsonii TaxID=28549 RepID=UPI002ED9EF81|nr:unnamed protein product [Priceomyces carsonii]
MSTNAINSFVYDPVPFDHTYILYDPTDLISVCSVHLSLLPIYIMVFYTSWFLITREIEPVIIVGGHLVGEILNKIFKVILRLPRPDFHKDFGSGSYGLTYGMPSAHSQFMGFFASYFICIILFKVHLTYRQKILGCTALSFISLLVAFSRVYLLYHTIPQVMVGCLIGTFLGLVYSIISSVVRDIGLVDWILGWPIVEFFYIKDSYYHNYQTFKHEYDCYLMSIGTLKTGNVYNHN